MKARTWNTTGLYKAAKERNPRQHDGLPRGKKRPNLAKLQQQCDAWNAAHPVGCDVVLAHDNGSQFPTKTRSEAQVLSGHSAVIWLDGVSGCYLLERVKAAADGVVKK